jgi:hypothetical protein
VAAGPVAAAADPVVVEAGEDGIKKTNLLFIFVAGSMQDAAPGNFFYL